MFSRSMQSGKPVKIRSSVGALVQQDANNTRVTPEGGEHEWGCAIRVRLIDVNHSSREQGDGAVGQTVTSGRV